MSAKEHPTGLSREAFMQLTESLIGQVRRGVVAEVPAQTKVDHDARVLTVLGTLLAAELRSHGCTVHDAITIMVDIMGPAQTVSVNSKGGAT